jgi:hypothetical protein
MTTRLEILLSQIDPARTMDEANRRIDEALNSFQRPMGTLTKWEDFRKCILRFHQHAEGKILGLVRPFSGDDKFDWGRCIGTLMKAFGKNGEKTAMQLVCTNVEGGLYRVLCEAGRALAEDYAENWVAGLVWNYWNSLSLAEKLAAPDEYITRFRHVLPSDLIEGNAGRIRAEFPRVLIEHPKLIQRLREASRR